MSNPEITVNVIEDDRISVAVIVGSTGSSGVTVHGELTGLDADDHTQYHDDARGDVRYTPIAHATDTTNPHAVTAAQAGADPVGTAASAVGAHEGAVDPHPQYRLSSDSVPWLNISGVPTSFPPEAHVHSPSDVTGTAVIDNDSRLSDARTPTAHSHSLSDVTDAGGMAAIDDAPSDGTTYGRKDGGWVAAAGGGGVPGGSTTQVQYNDAGAFAGSAKLTWDGSALTVDGIRAGRNSGGVDTSTAFGDSALSVNTTSNNTGIGYKALSALTTGNSNTAVGSNSMRSGTTTNQNTAVGTYSLGILSGLTGTANNAFGYNSLYSNTSGGGNTAIGVSTLGANTTGASNVGVGNAALRLNTIGGYNVSIGSTSLFNNTTGDHNTALGYQAGYNSGVGLTSSSLCTFLGADATASVDGLFNSAAIGAAAVVTKSNQIVLGNTSVTETLLMGNVGMQNGKALYLRGDATTDGSVRIRSDAANSAKLESRVSGVWTALTWS